MPRNVIFKRDATVRDDALLALLRLDEAHPQLVEEIVDELGFVRRQVALGLLLQQADQLDHLIGRHEVRLLRARRCSGSGMSPKCTAAVVASDSTKPAKEMPGLLISALSTLEC